MPNESAANESALREHVLALLEKEQAHAGFDKGVSNMPFELQGKRPQGAAHSPWDILEFVRDLDYVSPDWPSGYWPKSPNPPDEKAWDRTAAAFRADLEAMKELVRNEATDLFAPIPHGDGQTILREALLVADHNAYHLGELILLRRPLGAWK